MTPTFGWWNVLDGAMLQRLSWSKPGSAPERWLRIEKKAAKVGKGLVKNGKGRKLVSEHWLEAIDPLHRYGHNLHFYFEVWCQSETNEPFFYWLDFGEGKDLDLKKCPKSTLQYELIRYLGPIEREEYEVIIEDGKLLYKQTREPLNSTKGDKWIFVMSTSGVLYVGKKKKGNLQHSSFLAGAAITSAGRLRVKDGVIKLIEAHSGHYRPTPENFKQLNSILESRGADLTRAKMQYCSEEMGTRSKSLKCRQVYERRGKLGKDTSSTPATSLASQGSLSSQGSDSSLASQGSVEAAADGHRADEESEKEDSLKDLRDLGLSGKSDIFTPERGSDQEENGDDSSLSLGRNLVTENVSEQGSGSRPEEQQPRALDEAVSRGTAKQSESHANVERVQVGRVETESKEDGLNRERGIRKQIASELEWLPVKNEILG